MADRSGQQLGNYRLLNLLGQGGFAEVYLGEHVYLRTKAAIKILQMRLAVNDQEGLEGFLTEARTIANLVHPNIVRVLEFGLDGETPFLVMDYAPNGTLRQKYPKSRRLTLQEIAGSVKQVAAALQYAHNERLIHRDVKPENMLVGRHDEILLSDFGIALVAQSSRYQGTSDVVGTVAYMSPEQIQGKPRPASDQYSLGIVVYEWLTGERPFRGSFTELCTQHMFATPDPIREKVPDISSEVEQVVTTALAKDPKQRFMSVQAFANALEQACLPGSTAGLRPSSQLLSSSPSFTPTPPSAPSTWVPPTERSNAPVLPPTQMATPSSWVPPTERVSAPIIPPRQTPSPSSPVRTSAPAPRQSGSTPAYGQAQYGQRAASVDSGEKVSAWRVLGRIAGQLVGVVYVDRGEKVSAWRVGKRQIWAMLIGAVLYSILGSFSVYTGSNLIVSALAIPLFFGVIYGPWVGLVTGGVGVLIGGVVLPLFGIYLHGYWDIGSFEIGFGYFDAIYILLAAPLGFIAGLAILRTRGRYNNIGSITVATTISAISIIVIYSLLLVLFGGGQYLWESFNHFTLPNVVCAVILLPIALFIYNKIVSNRRRALG